jgi:hypothetical protein
MKIKQKFAGIYDNILIRDEKDEFEQGLKSGRCTRCGAKLWPWERLGAFNPHKKCRPSMSITS